MIRSVFDLYIAWKNMCELSSNSNTECSSCDLIYLNIDGLEQEKRNSIAKALELRLSCTNPLIWSMFLLAVTGNAICMMIAGEKEVGWRPGYD